MNIIVTGASKGIGYEIAKQFYALNNNNIIVISRNREKLEDLKVTCETNKKTSKIIPIVYDLNETTTKSTDIQKVIKKVFAKIDILINNAGILLNKKYTEYSENEKKQIFITNFFIPAKLIECLLPLMNAPSHIVNIGSMGGYQGSVKFPGLSYYSASKAAIACLTECLAEEYKEEQIHFNCLALGAVQTEMLNEAFPGYKAPLKACEMAEFIVNFAINGHKYFNGKILPVALTTP
ncbi:MAG: SDR family oxidoreductase [Bacteroidales bacterium]|nr:SDR family oxidoreductase [Bacteroidales bacterium]